MKSSIARFTIQSQSVVDSYIENWNLKQGASLQDFCIEACSRSEGEGIRTVIVKIKLKLLPHSYHNIPAMFARSVTMRTVDYDVHQSYIEKDYLVYRAGFSKKPITFKARAIASIIRSREFLTPSDKAPTTYRKQPRAFARMLTAETGYQIATIAKKKTISWKVVDKED